MDVMEPPQSEELLTTVLSQAEEMAIRGFNLMETHAARDLQSEEDLVALQEAVDKLYQKVQEKACESLIRWGEYCNSLSAAAQTESKPEMPSSYSRNYIDTCADSSKLLEELRHWSIQADAEESRAAYLRREMEGLERYSLKLQQAHKLYPSKDSSQKSKIVEDCEAFVKLCDSSKESAPHQVPTETPAPNLPTRFWGPL